MKAIKMEEDLNSCLILFELTGLQCFSLKSLTQDNAENRPSISRTVFMLVLFVFVNALVIFYVHHDHSIIEGDLTSKNVIIYVIKQSMNVGLVALLSVSFLQSYTSTQSIKKIYLNSKEIARLCLKFKLNIDFKKIKKDAWKRIWAMLGFILVMHGSVMLAHLNCPNNILQLILGIFPMLFLLMIVFKFVFYVNIVNHQLQLLEKLFKDAMQYEPVKVIESNIDVYLTQVKSSTPIDDKTLNKLRVVWKIYNVIYDNGALINQSIGLTVLSLLMGLVIALTVSGYEIFVTVVGGRPLQNIPGKST